jgi:hypothetical protein
VPGIKWSKLPQDQRVARTAEAEHHLAASGYSPAELPQHRRIPCFDPIRGVVIRGDGAPKAKDAARFFARFPYLSACLSDEASGASAASSSSSASAAGATGLQAPAWLRRGASAHVPVATCINPGIVRGAAIKGPESRRRGIFFCVSKIRNTTRRVSAADELRLVHQILEFLASQHDA